MPRAAARFRQADIARAIKAMVAAGLTVGRVEIDPVTGKVNIEARESSNREKPVAVGALAEWRARRGQS